MFAVSPLQSASAQRSSGWSGVGAVSWGTHLCHFYRTREELLDCVSPFFAAGLEGNERCVWVTSPALPPAEALNALRSWLPGVDQSLQRGQLEVLPHDSLYPQRTSPDLDRALEQWLEREHHARAAGYDGLRVCGNVFWPDQVAWPAYANFEARAHVALQSRHVLALCSYFLDRCGAEEIVDVLRNHRFALMRGARGWEIVDGATATLAAIGGRRKRPASPRPGVTSRHAARFYEENAYPSAEIAAVLERALRQGRAALVFASRPHLDEIERALRALDVDVNARTESGQLTLTDGALVTKALIDGAVPPRVIFDETIARAVNEALGRYDSACVFGEVVDALARSGHAATALQLERWWNDLLATTEVELWCGYEVGSLEHDAAWLLPDICAEHDVVDAEAASDALSPRSSEPAVHARGLCAQENGAPRDAHGSAERAARLHAQATAQHLTRLQQLTTSLLDLRVTSEIGATVARELCRVFSARSAVLALRAEEGGGLALVGHAHLPQQVLERYEASTLDDDLPITAAFQSGAPLWLNDRQEIEERFPSVLSVFPEARSIACVPLIVSGEHLGAMALVHHADHLAPAWERALLEDYARQVALTVSRALAYEQAESARRRSQILADTMARFAEGRLDVAELVDCLVHEVTRSGFADCCAVNLRDEHSRVLPLAAVRHVDLAVQRDIELTLRAHPVEVGSGIVGGVCATGQSVRINSRRAVEELARADYRAQMERTPVRALIVAPLRVSGEIVGAITASRNTGQAYGIEDERLVREIAERAAFAIQNARLFARAEAERRRAEAANRAKDEFLAVLGHELRNPLSPILTAVHVMRMRGEDALLKERTVIERQVNHMVRLVDDLLDVSRVTQGKVDLRLEPLELGAVVANGVEIASPMLEAKSHELVTRVPASGLTVLADAGRLTQVIANLLTNAAKFTPDRGRIVIEASIQEKRVALRIRDNGAGIDAELLPRVFELFVQGKQKSDRATGGLGLGLSIAKKLVELHGGRLYAESEGPGRGSTFTLELGLTDSALERASARRSSLASAGPSRRVLVVDDNPDAAQLLGEALTMMGHDVRVAHDGPSALRAAARYEPELALLDLGLPVMDGYELAKNLVATFHPAPPRLVAVSGYGTAADRRRSIDAGFAEHLVKPVALERLQALLAELFPIAARAT